MPKCCCCKDLKNLCEDLECRVDETQKGVQITVSAKDETKTESLKALVKNLHDCCGCCK